ncbi:MAG: Tim44-like domain-containing protein [Deltaproteobacteria bacterium]|nr:Tim44-like domain-containing protein [Myxococcales bacterium]MDP3213870.1 Tim44-like domain-containing protein [Deltaproteobacteria bacterium]
MKRRRYAVAILLAVLVVLVAGVALARPGGGGSFSGGGGSGSGSGGGSFGGGSSSSSGGSGDDLAGALLGALFEVVVNYLFALAVEHPQVSIPLVAAAVIAYLLTRRDPDGFANVGFIAAVIALLPLGYFAPWAFIGTLAVAGAVALYRWREKSDEGWTATVEDAPEAPSAATRAPEPMSQARASLQALRAVDPDFSVVVLEDFLYALYAEVQRARGSGTLDTLVAYVSADVRRKLSGAGLASVEDVIVGALRWRDVAGTEAHADRTRLRVDFEANYTEVAKDGTRQGVYVIERWTLVRKGGVKSRAPERATVIGCPACGAPRDRSVGGVCDYCKAPLTRGDLDWTVTNTKTLSHERRSPVLESSMEEQGTRYDTVLSPTLQADLAALAAHDPAFSLEALRPRVELIFGELQGAWSTRDWKRARPFVSDLLFESQRSWIEAYRRAGLRNLTDGARVLGMEAAAVTMDRWFHAVTVRVRASSKDYTVDEAGELTSGDRDREREYTEYWTLIRSAKRRGAAGVEPVCPNCGAGLAINQAGECEFCKVKVTTGEFDWVLSRIEQDDSYSG